MRLADSVLAGVPLQGTLRWRSDGAGKPTLDLDAAGNRLHADGRIDIDARGAGDRWDVQLDAPALDRLAPLARLMQAAPGSADLAGSITLSAHATGRWPALTTDGELDARALRWDAWRVRRAEARWQARHARRCADRCGAADHGRSDAARQRRRAIGAVSRRTAQRHRPRAQPRPSGRVEGLAACLDRGAASRDGAAFDGRIGAGCGRRPGARSTPSRR